MDGRDALTVYIDFATSLVQRDRRIMGAVMGLEIKGLGNALQGARKAISDVRAETNGLQEDTRAFISDVRDVRTQIKKHHDDLKFEVGTLGNGAPEDSTAEKPSDSSGQPFSGDDTGNKA